MLANRSPHLFPSESDVVSDDDHVAIIGPDRDVVILNDSYLSSPHAIMASRLENSTQRGIDIVVEAKSQCRPAPTRLRGHAAADRLNIRDRKVRIRLKDALIRKATTDPCFNCLGRHASAGEHRLAPEHAAPLFYLSRLIT